MARNFSILIASALLAATPVSAFACLKAPQNYSDAQLRAAAQRFVARSAAVIVDGEIVEVRTDGLAKVRIERVLKGEVGKTLWMQETGSTCDPFVPGVGARDRWVLWKSSEVYTLTRPPSSDEFVDEVLGSDRIVDWPYVAGMERTLEPVQSEGFPRAAWPLIALIAVTVVGGTMYFRRSSPSKRRR